METEVPDRKFEVNATEKCIVKALTPLPNSQILTLSNLDLLSGRFPVSYLYLYRNSQKHSFQSVVESLRISLSETLNYYYPFAGQILENPDTNEPVIICDNNGVLIRQGHANTSLKNLDLYNLNESLPGKLVPVDEDEFPLKVQVTSFTCGGISVTFTFDHVLGDAGALGKFLLSWSEIAQGKPISCVPDHRRNLPARSPPTYNPCLDHTFVKCSMEEVKSIPTRNITLKRLYHIDASCIDRLQQLACANGQKRTKVEAFSAYVWKMMVTAIDEERHKKCKMGWLVDGRGRLRLLGAQNSMSNYIGNVLSLAVGEANIAQLKQNSLADVASAVHAAISKVSNEEHFLDLIDWVECHRPGLMMSNVVLGRGGPALVVSSGRRFPVVELDFGFGCPVLGTLYSSIERSGVGYMNQRPSARNDGSWTVSSILWPELATVLESDSIFQPMSSTLLQLY